MINCIIIDDEPFARELLKEYISKVDFLTVIGEFKNPLEAINSSILDQTDLIFLDIQMPGITGVDFLKSISPDSQVIFTTAYAEYAIEGFELDVVDYLLKPFSFSRFLKSANKILSTVPKKTIQNSSNKEFLSQDHFFVKDGNKLKRVNIEDILYIKGMRDYVSIVTTSGTITSLQNMKDLQISLPSKFIRIHNSYIISMDHVSEVSRDSIKIGEIFLPISQTYKQQFHEYMKKHV